MLLLWAVGGLAITRPCYLYLFLGVDGSVNMDDATQREDHSSGSKRNPELTNKKVKKVKGITLI